MVKVVSPCMSQSASGSLGKSLVFSIWKGRPYVRSLVRPANPKSGLQTAQRAMLRFLTRWWNTSSPAPTAVGKSSWETEAKTMQASTFNAFVSENLLRWTNGEPPIPTPTAAATAAVNAPQTHAAAGGVHNATISIKNAAANPANGYIIRRNLGAAVPATKDTIIAVVPAADATGAATQTYTDSPVEPGTYTYAVQPFDAAGNLGANTTCGEAVVS